MGAQQPGGEKKHISVGLLAHVDAGKTTLSEAFLYTGGALRKLGRVDHKDAFLDNFAMERERGITIFSKQARVCWKGLDITLLDTPGHVDFCAETERTLQVLDYCLLVISGSDGVQAHTGTLWRLLKAYRIPVFLFVNKMDQPGAEKEKLLRELKTRLDENCMEFGPEAEGGGRQAEEGFSEGFLEELSMCDEGLLEEYLETGGLKEASIARAVARRSVFPCYFGSALRLEGVEELLDGLSRYSLEKEYPSEFGARVYKISRDANGSRLTHLKVTGGVLRVKMPVDNGCSAGSGEEVWEEKADQLRIYDGAGFRLAEQVRAGEICAVTGLDRTFAGQGLGRERENSLPVLSPVLTYRLELPEGADVVKVLGQLRQLEEEEPQLHVVWREASREIHAQVMGEVQIEILKRQLQDRFGLEAEFADGGILYKETIASSAEGIGHFEPLRHYAEVHLLLEPGEPGSGLQFFSACSEDVLDRNWQRLILTHLEEKTHLGVLTGSPVTDMKVTLLTGRAHIKHTEGGDFRQATYRALRQGLMQCDSVLLEPVLSFTLEVPSRHLGRAMTDIRRMCGSFEDPVIQQDVCILSGSVPAAALKDYQREVNAYTGGTGRLSCALKGYEPCHNGEEVVSEIGYDPLGDVENTGDSVFCAHGAGFLVSWDRVPEFAHVESGWRPDSGGEEQEGEAEALTEKLRAETLRGGNTGPGAGRITDTRSGKTPSQNTQTGSGRKDYITQEEIEQIFQQTYRKGKQDYEPYRYHQQNLGRGVYGAADGEDSEKNRAQEEGKTQVRENGKSQAQEEGGRRRNKKQEATASRTEYFLVDGYNIIFAWKELRELAAVNIDSARDKLMDICCNFQGYRGCTLILVFDAYKVKGNPGSVRKYHNIYVVYTREAETADQYIEKTVHDLGRKHRVTVATSDAMEQMIIWGDGALRLSAAGFLEAVEGAGASFAEKGLG